MDVADYDAPAPWKVRLVGGAAGVAASLAIAGITFGTGIGLIIGLAGVPGGALVGWLFAPALLRARHPGPLVVLAALVALPLGIVTYIVAITLMESRGASLSELIAYASEWLWIYAAWGVLAGTPMALAAAAGASWWLRRRAARSIEGWLRPSAGLLGFVALLCVVFAFAAFFSGGSEAASAGDVVPLRYVVRSAAPSGWNDPQLMLEIRSYWEGGESGGSSGAIGGCSWGDDWLQSSDWAMWIDPEGEWTDRPLGEPLVSSADFPRGEPVELTITVDADGTATWERGVHGSC